MIEVDPLVIRRLRALTVGQAPRAVAVSSDSLWVANFGDDTVTRLQIESKGADADDHGHSGRRRPRRRRIR